MHTRRNNKHLKSMVKNPHHPDVSMAKATVCDVASRHLDLKAGTTRTRSERHHPHPRRPHDCVLWGRSKTWFPTTKELGDLRLSGIRVTDFGVTAYDMAYILNVHFKAGEWPQPRCGSVITCVVDGRSLYARVRRFLQVDGDSCPGYASVGWFGNPTYPLSTPMVVKVPEDGTALDDELGCIIRITQIDPSRVIVEPDPVNGCYFMMRDSGYDTRST